MIQWRLLNELTWRHYRLVELEKLRLKTRRDGGIRSRRISGFASGLSVRRIIRTNRSGVTEIRLPACLQCGVELCESVHCVKFTYEDFLRQQSDLGDEGGDKTKEADPADEEEEKRIQREENKKQVITSMKGTAMKMKQAKKHHQSNKRPAPVRTNWWYAHFYLAIGYYGLCSKYIFSSLLFSLILFFCI